VDKKIGELAGEVWDYLDENGETSVSQVSREIEAPKAKVDMAIGWLAREEKLDFNEKSRGFTVELG
jgi:hypothetical protein